MTKPVRKTALAVVKPPALPADYITLAIERGLPPEVLSKLIDNAERIEVIRARKAFDVAMAAAKAEIPVILKTNTVDFTTARGRTHYQYEDFATIADIVGPILSAHGIDFRFRTTSDRDTLTVTCIMAGHGHREENSLTAPNDLSGNKNPIQAIGSTQTYLQRYTLKAAIGLAATRDDDAQSVTQEAPPPKKLEPKVVEAPKDPETGKSGPHVIAVPQKEDGGKDWIGYGSLFLAAVKDAKDQSEIEDWKDINRSTLDELEQQKDAKGEPKIYRRLMSAIGLPAKK